MKNDSISLPTVEERSFLGVRETAAVLGMSTDAIYDAINRGELPSIRVGKTIRIPVAELRRLAGLE